MLETFFKAIGMFNEASCARSLICMCFRGFIIYAVSLLLIKFNKKFIGVRTPFNFILFIMLASLSAFAITSQSEFIPIFGVIIFLMVLNRATAALAYRFPRFERLFKGKAILLIQNGQLLRENMKKNNITHNDLITELHRQMHTDDISVIESAFFEGNGKITFIKR